MPASVATGRRWASAGLHARKPCSGKAVRFGKWRDPPLGVPTDHCEGGRYRTFSADRDRPFSAPAVGRGQTTSHCVSEMRSRSAQIGCEIKGDRARRPPNARFRVYTMRNAYMRLPSSAEAGLCLGMHNGTASEDRLFVHRRLDRFFSDWLGSCPPDPILFEVYASEPSVARPLGPGGHR